jgi:hypothetical protein
MDQRSAKYAMSTGKIDTGVATGRIAAVDACMPLKKSGSGAVTGGGAGSTSAPEPSKRTSTQF